MGLNRQRVKGRRDGETFLMLPHTVIKSPQFACLSYSAAKLLIDIASEYTGKNNGNLLATHKAMEPKGWKSNDTLTNARKELERMGFIVMTKQGGLRCGPNLYAITWRGIDDCGGRHNFPPSDRSLDLWKKIDPPVRNPVQRAPNTGAVKDKSS
ncbi:MAG: hypothetical protein AAF265_05655 [Pseudomonadota bacterium]